MFLKHLPSITLSLCSLSTYPQSPSVYDPSAPALNHPQSMILQHLPSITLSLCSLSTCSQSPSVYVLSAPALNHPQSMYLQHLPSITFSICSSLNAIKEASRPYNSIGKFIILYFNFQVFRQQTGNKRIMTKFVVSTPRD